MLFERFEVEGLSHYAYAVGCAGAGEVIVVDPERNIDVYLEFAAAHGLRITHILETHIHADYASGARALGARTGAPVCVSAYDAGETYEVSFPHRDLRGGDAIVVGNIRIVARHTPGHTPEHLSYVVYDGNRAADTPMLMLSGDFLFVGSLGRPDLLGDEQKRGLARQLFASVQTLDDLPDGLEIHPAHGAGSMCGAGMSGRPLSTLGFERIANPYLDRTLDEAAFVERILGTVPPFPPYYRRMKTLNARGADDLDETQTRTAFPADRFRTLIDEGHVVIDLRAQLDFGGGHVPGSFGIGLGPGLATWAAWVVPYDHPILLVTEHAGDATLAARTLARVGLDRVAGHLDGGIAAWREAGGELARTETVPPDEVHARLTRGEPLRLVDVRGDAEWNEGHAPGAIHLMGGTLAEHLDELPDPQVPVAVVCRTGYRSTVAASVLERAGYEHVVDVIGGMTAWQAAGLPMSRPGAEILA